MFSILSDYQWILPSPVELVHILSLPSPHPIFTGKSGVGPSVGPQLWESAPIRKDHDLYVMCCLGRMPLSVHCLDWQHSACLWSWSLGKVDSHIRLTSWIWDWWLMVSWLISNQFYLNHHFMRTIFYFHSYPYLLSPGFLFSLFKIYGQSPMLLGIN